MANLCERFGVRGLVLAVGLVLMTAPARAQVEPDQTKDETLTLERIFPEKGFFGPGARSMAFSHDGRFAAFLYRPWIERRHGNDLYVMDTQTGTVRRVTSASRMGEFQEDARKVREDREKRAKKAGLSVEDLAIEQHRRHGWDLPGVLGRWSGRGEGVGREAPMASGVATLVVRTGKELSGELQIGLTALGIAKGTFDGGTLSAEIRGVGGVAADGSLSLTLKDGTLSGTLTLTKPEGSVRLTFERDADGKESGAGAHRAVGVIGAWGERLSLGDVVLEDDEAINDEDKDGKRPKELAPRYGGVSGFEFSPTGDEMLIESGGDLYRLEIDRAAWEASLAAPAALEIVRPDLGTLTRLTRTGEREAGAAYLEDGSGYTYMRDGALMIVRFGEHRIVQLDPRLEDGERMSAYRLSPDMKRVVFLAARGESFWNQGRQVTIVNYRERFAQATQVTRHMPDDPWPDAWSSIYLYDLEGHEREEGTLRRVFTRRLSGPRDVMALPEWSADSSRVAFSAYDQASGNVMILEAGFEDREPGENPSQGGKGGAGSAEAREESESQGDSGAKEDGEKKDDERRADFEIFDAKVVYRFLHFGGPNTPGMVRPVYLADNRRMAFITELSGYRQLHVLDPVYERMTQLTEGAFEVYPIEVSKDHTTMFVSATRDDPNQEHVFRVDLATGEMTRLSETAGRYTGSAVRDDGSMVLANFVDFGAPGELVLVTPGQDAPMRVLTDSHPGEAHALTRVSPEYFTFENRHGQTIHGHMFKPRDWTAEDKRPLLIYVYGGPLGEAKMAHRGSYAAPSYFFARYMAEVHGWVTATIDPRGASGYGALFEKANFERVGKPQTEDLVDGARWLVEHAGVDEKRMAMHGWSFGGFQTQMVMYSEPDVFAVGIAGAGPTEWHNYNSWYSTGTIGQNEAGRTSLEKFSLLPLAKNLKGHLLLVHGVEDSNVLFQDTMRVYRELLKADKEVLVELFLDPTGGHGLGGDVQTINRYRKYEDFLLRYLGKGSPGDVDDAGNSAKGSDAAGGDGEI